jgi:hypothetical protein
MGYLFAVEGMYQGFTGVKIMKNEGNGQSEVVITYGAGMHFHGE